MFILAILLRKDKAISLYNKQINKRTYPNIFFRMALSYIFNFRILHELIVRDADGGLYNQQQFCEEDTRLELAQA